MVYDNTPQLLLQSVQFVADLSRDVSRFLDEVGLAYEHVFSPSSHAVFLLFVCSKSNPKKIISTLSSIAFSQFNSELRMIYRKLIGATDELVLRSIAVERKERGSVNLLKLISERKSPWFHTPSVRFEKVIGPVYESALLARFTS